ncbi:energy transducer TonB, partial [Tepidimonas alkaliphilus]|uniref:energy transducer TonB n=1 Tax=Tepidimonas alkaliphilus TaxID=2588942 RepID=UPI00117FB20E
PAPSPRPRTQAATSQPTRPPVTPTAAEPSQAAEPTPAPTPVAEALRDPAPTSPPAPSAPGPSAAAAPVAAPAAPAVAAAPPAPPPKIELPSASAAYLNNPPPAYPALSRRLGEQGRVVLRVRIEPDGTASAAEIRTSSGYERLDKAALEAVLRWRYVPGKRDGVPEAMWFLVPIQFVLE